MSGEFLAKGGVKTPHLITGDTSDPLSPQVTITAPNSTFNLQARSLSQTDVMSVLLDKPKSSGNPYELIRTLPAGYTPTKIASRHGDIVVGTDGTWWLMYNAQNKRWNTVDNSGVYNPKDANSYITSIVYDVDSTFWIAAKRDPDKVNPAGLYSLQTSGTVNTSAIQGFRQTDVINKTSFYGTDTYTAGTNGFTIKGKGDFAARFVRVNPGSNDVIYNGLFFDGKKYVLYGEHGIVTTSTDAVTWATPKTPLGDTNIVGMEAYDSKGTTIVLTGNGGLWTTSNFAMWSAIVNPPFMGPEIITSGTLIRGDNYIVVNMNDNKIMYKAFDTTEFTTVTDVVPSGDITSVTETEGVFYITTKSPSALYTYKLPFVPMSVLDLTQQGVFSPAPQSLENTALVRMDHLNSKIDNVKVEMKGELLPAISKLQTDVSDLTGQTFDYGEY